MFALTPRFVLRYPVFGICNDTDLDGPDIEAYGLSCRVCFALMIPSMSLYSVRDCSVVQNGIIN